MFRICKKKPISHYFTEMFKWIDDINGSSIYKQDSDCPIQKCLIKVRKKIKIVSIYDKYNVILENTNNMSKGGYILHILNNLHKLNRVNAEYIIEYIVMPLFLIESEYSSSSLIVYIQEHYNDIFEILLKLYTDKIHNHHVTGLLSYILKDKKCALLFLQDGFWFTLINGCNTNEFVISASSFALLSIVLQPSNHNNKVAVNKYLIDNYSIFISNYNKLLTSNIFSTRIFSLKLLLDIMLFRSFYEFMIKYVSDVNNLKLCLNLLLDSSIKIKCLSYGILKCFIANPTKPTDIISILYNNKSRLIQVLNGFNITFINENTQKEHKQIHMLLNDEIGTGEITYIINMMEKLKI